MEGAPGGYAVWNSGRSGQDGVWAPVRERQAHSDTASASRSPSERGRGRGVGAGTGGSDSRGARLHPCGFRALAALGLDTSHGLREVTTLRRAEALRRLNDLVR